MNIREKIEQKEITTLSQFATKSRFTQGRTKTEEKCNIRTDFQRDRDRIIHSKAFRRLKHKTQVFFSPDNDHYRTRMTHTLEVSQIARTLSRALDLNEDLTEAISLGHDLGHTPFGHSGERALNDIMQNGFKHNIQSLRVVNILENLNLTKEVTDGILTHSWGCKPITLEGQVVQLADKIAYINHDIQDAILAGIITENNLPLDCTKYFSSTNTNRLSFMIQDIINNSADKSSVSMTEECWYYLNKLRNWMFEHVYLNESAKTEEDKIDRVIQLLFDYFYNFVNSRIKESDDIIQLAVCDYIAGMTDRYAINKFNEVFVPKSLKVKVSDEQIFKLVGIDRNYAKF